MRRIIPLLALALCACQKPGTTPTPTLTPATPLPTATGSQELPPDIDPALDKGQLRAFYRKKYTEEERKAVRQVVEDLLPNYSPEEKTQAIAEILAFSYVVFHKTEYHHLELNHEALRKHEAALVDQAKRYQVPPLAVTAIVSWENSGGSTKVSAADAAGLGQMTDGAIQSAHDYAHREAARLRQEATDPASVEEIAKWLESVEIRHQKAAHKAKMPDERFVPECNLEDVVLFFRSLLGQLGGRVDHAIGAYHKGIGNTDDLLFDYMTHHGIDVVDPRDGDRTDFLANLERANITYLTLWNDTRSRQMLNGLRTMDGEVTTDDNRSQALGDESDIYPWKVMGSLAAYRQGPDYVKKQIERYSPPQSEVEVSGLPVYENTGDIHRALKDGRLVHSRAPLSDMGYLSGMGQAYIEVADCITPELEGYLFSLVSRWRKAANQESLVLPVKCLLNAKAMERGGYGLFSKVQLRGVTALIAPQELRLEQQQALTKVLEVDFLNDRIYRSTLENGDILICLNPRFGHQFLAAYQKYRDR